MKIKIFSKKIEFIFPENCAFKKKLIKRYKGFLSDFNNPDFRIFVKTKRMPKNPFFPKIRKKEKTLMIKRGDFNFSFDFKEGFLETAPSVYSFDSFLRIIFSGMALKENFALLHCCAIARNNRAYVFFGVSGSGKSTLAKIAKKNNWNILSDELCFVGLKNNKPFIYSSPFFGEMKGRGSYFKKNLSGIFFLKKSKENFITKISLKEFEFNLLKCIMNFSKDKLTAVLALNIACGIYKNENAKKGYFYFSKKDASFLKLLYY